MDLIHPHTKGDVADVLRDASARGRPLLVVGGRTHMDKGNPVEVDGELWTTMLDEIVAYEPAEMIAVVEAGVRVGDLQRLLAENGQEWPSDAPAEATVGGVIASGASSPRRLRVGAIRDTVLEMELVTGDGRLIKSGARTVKNVTGYEIHKLAAGSLGTLGVIVQVALRLRPLPAARRTIRIPGGFEAARRSLDEVPGAAAVLATPEVVEVRLEGWPEEVAAQTEAAWHVAAALDSTDDAPFPSERPWDGSPVVAEAAVPPSKLPDLVAAANGRWGALVGVGIAWCGLEDANGSLDALRNRAAALGGVAPVIRGPGGLGDATPAALGVHSRLKVSFDPAGVLAPGRFWGGI